MTALQAAIDTHPMLWERMIRLEREWRDHPGTDRASKAYHRLWGMVEALSIVGEFDPEDIWVRLAEDTYVR